MKVIKGIKDNTGINYEVAVNATTESVPQNTLELLLKYGIDIVGETGNKIIDLSQVKVVETDSATPTKPVEAALDESVKPINPSGITSDEPVKPTNAIRSTADVLKNISNTAPVEEEEEIDFASVFTNLGLDKAKQLIQEKVDSGMSDEDAFNEVFQMEQDLGDIGIEEEEEEIDLYDEDSSDDIDYDEAEAEEEIEEEYEPTEEDEDMETSLLLIDKKIELLKELDTLPYFTVNQQEKTRKAEILAELKEYDDNINSFGTDEYIDESETITSNTWRLELEMQLENEYKSTGNEIAHERLHALQAQPYMDVDNKVSRLYAMLKKEENGQQKIDLIQNYFLWYSRRVFNRESKVSPRPISLKKSAKLDEIRNSSSNWGYAGFVDFFYRGAEHCHFGHALRYVHYIWDLEETDIERYFFGDSINAVADILNNPNVHYYKFGATCAGDFFKLDDESLKLFEITQRAVLSSFEELCDIYESGMADKIKQYCDELDKIVAETSGHHAMMQILFDEKEADYKKTDNFLANPRLEYFYTEFRNFGIVPPKIMVQELRDSYAYGIAFYYWKSIKNRNWWVRSKADIIASMEIEKFKGEYRNHKHMFSYKENRELMYKLLETLTGEKLEVRELPTPIDEYLNIYYLFRLAGLYMYGPRAAKTIPTEGISLIDAFRSLEENGKDRTVGRGSEDDYAEYCGTLKSAPCIDSLSVNMRGYYLADFNGEQTDAFMPQILENPCFTLEYVKAVFLIYTLESKISEALTKFAISDYKALLAADDILDGVTVENGVVNTDDVVVPVISFDSDSIVAFGNAEFTKAAMLLYWVYKSIGSRIYKYSIEFKLPKAISVPKEQIKETSVGTSKLRYYDGTKLEQVYGKNDLYDAISILPEIQNALNVVDANIDAYIQFSENSNTDLAELKEIYGTVEAFYKAIDKRFATNEDDTDLTIVEEGFAKAVSLNGKAMSNYTVYIKKSMNQLSMAVGKANLVDFEYLRLHYNAIELSDNFYIDKMLNLFKEPEQEPEPEKEAVTSTIDMASPATNPTDLMSVLNNTDLSGIKVNTWVRDTLLPSISGKNVAPDDLTPKQLTYLGKLYKELTGLDYGGEVLALKTELSDDVEGAINFALEHKDEFINQYDARTLDIISTVLKYKEYSEKQGKYVDKAVEFQQNHV